jgi:aspartate/methionine/tyrosine aminotransferase
MTVIAQTLRAARVPPFHAMAMSRLASEREAAGHAVLHLEVGQPGTPAPAAARHAVIRHLERADPMGYTNAAGLISLRQRIARLYLDRHSVHIDPSRVMVVGGASAGFSLAFLTCFDAGARVGVIEPGYPCYRNTLLALGAVPVPIPVGADTRWAPTVPMLEAAGPLDGVVVASPSNPTGTMLSRDTMSSIVEWCATHGTQLVSDEIYHGITYDGIAHSALEAGDDVVVVNSFSKYYSMTGWRLGWTVVPDRLVDAIERFQQNFYICASHIAQVAGLAALDAGDELDAHVRRYAAQRQLLVDGLAHAGTDQVAAADGAFYVYADVGSITHALGIDSSALCHRWLDELSIATTPGIDFDLARGDRFVRFSYAGSADDIAAACDRLARWRR